MIVAPDTYKKWEGTHLSCCQATEWDQVGTLRAPAYHGVPCDPGLFIRVQPSTKRGTLRNVLRLLSRRGMLIADQSSDKKWPFHTVAGRCLHSSNLHGTLPDDYLSYNLQHACLFFCSRHFRVWITAAWSHLADAPVQGAAPAHARDAHGWRGSPPRCGGGRAGSLQARSTKRAAARPGTLQGCQGLCCVPGICCRETRVLISQVCMVVQQDSCALPWGYLTPISQAKNLGRRFSPPEHPKKR